MKIRTQSETDQRHQILGETADDRVLNLLLKGDEMVSDEDDACVLSGAANETIECESDCERWLQLSPETSAPNVSSESDVFHEQWLQLSPESFAPNDTSESGDGFYEQWLQFSPEAVEENDTTESEGFHERWLQISPETVSLSRAVESDTVGKNAVQMKMKDMSEEVLLLFRSLPEADVAIQNIESVDEGEVPAIFEADGTFENVEPVDEGELPTYFEAAARDETPKRLLFEPVVFVSPEAVVTIENIDLVDKSGVPTIFEADGTIENADPVDESKVSTIFEDDVRDETRKSNLFENVVYVTPEADVTIENIDLVDKGEVTTIFEDDVLIENADPVDESKVSTIFEDDVRDETRKSNLFENVVYVTPEVDVTIENIDVGELPTIFEAAARDETPKSLIGPKTLEEPVMYVSPEADVKVENVDPVDEGEEQTIFETDVTVENADPVEEGETPTFFEAFTRDETEPVVYVSPEDVTVNGTVEVEGAYERWLQLSPETEAENETDDENSSLGKVAEEGKQLFLNFPETYVLVEKMNVETCANDDEEEDEGEISMEAALIESEATDEDEKPLSAVTRSEKSVETVDEDVVDVSSEGVSTREKGKSKRRPRKVRDETARIDKLRRSETLEKRALRSSCGAPVKSYKMESETDEEEEEESEQKRKQVSKERVLRSSSGTVLKSYMAESETEDRDENEDEDWVPKFDQSYLRAMETLEDVGKKSWSEFPSKTNETRGFRGEKEASETSEHQRRRQKRAEDHEQLKATLNERSVSFERATQVNDVAELRRSRLSYETERLKRLKSSVISQEIEDRLVRDSLAKRRLRRFISRITRSKR